MATQQTQKSYARPNRHVDVLVGASAFLATSFFTANPVLCLSFAFWGISLLWFVRGHFG